METNDEKRPFIAGVEVPKRVIQVWLGGEMPPEVRELVAGVRRVCELAGWAHVLVDDGLLRVLEGASPSLWGTLKRCCHVSQRSNVIRYWLLGSLGGLYLDADVKLWRLPEDLRGVWVCPSTDITLNPCVLAAPADDPFVVFLVKLLGVIDLGVDGSAGPALLTDAVAAWTGGGVSKWNGGDWMGGAYGKHLYWRHRLGSHLKP